MAGRRPERTVDRAWRFAGRRLPRIHRIIVFGANEEQARAATQEIAKNAFHNVSYFAGTLDDPAAGLGEPATTAHVR